MTGWWNWFERFLDTNPRDVGCDQTLAVLHVYVERLASGLNVARQFPGVAAHLSACDTCAEIARGVLLAVQAENLEG